MDLWFTILNFIQKAFYSFWGVLCFCWSSKGEFGVFISSFDFNRAYRCRIKSPGFLHLQALNSMISKKSVLLADLVTIIGSLDLVFGEIDR